MQEFTLFDSNTTNMSESNTTKKEKKKAGYQARIASIFTNINLCSTSA